VGEAISVWYNLRKAPLFKEHFPCLEKVLVRTGDADRSLEMGSERKNEVKVFVGKIRLLEGRDIEIVLVNMDRKVLA